MKQIANEAPIGLFSSVLPAFYPSDDPTFWHEPVALHHLRTELLGNRCGMEKEGQLCTCCRGWRRAQSRVGHLPEGKRRQEGALVANLGVPVIQEIAYKLLHDGGEVEIITNFVF